MKSLIAFMKKEWMEQVRSGRFMILGIVFVLFGIMNPAVAKLTPWMLELMADSLAESGMQVTTVEVDAMTSWVQFFKNIPMGLIVFVLMQSSIFTKEYESGTLVLALTKGLKRRNVVFAKTLMLTVLWTLYYWICYGVTYVYNAYFWDNSIASNLTFSAVCWWVFGLWTIALLVLFSTLTDTGSLALLGTGVVAVGAYLIGLLPKVKEYSPSLLMDGNSLIYGLAKPEDYGVAMVVTVVFGLVCLGLSVPVLDKKRI